MSNRGKFGVAALIAALIAGALIYNSESNRNARFVKLLVTQNTEARGGADAWQAITSMRLSGLMDLGQELAVPYTLEQKRPSKMCFSFEFADETAVQCVDGDSGWKVLPFRNRRTPEAMTANDLKEAADLADIDGLLFNYEARGHELTYVGEEVVDSRPAHKLHVQLPRGGERWVYLDQETHLELMVETTRTVGGRQRSVFTKYDDWRDTDGVLIPHFQNTLTEGMADSNFLTVERVTLNPEIDDARFVVPDDAERLAASTPQ